MKPGKLLATLAAICGLLMAPLSQAATFDVYAKVNSSTGGTGVDTLTFSLGDWFSVSADPGDLWSAGALPRWSNADGLIGDLFATGSDESGQPAGTLIGQNYGPYTKDGFTAPYGALVGRIGGSNYFLIGTSFSGQANASGVLKLFYWDENSFDNADHIAVTVTAVPEPGALAMLLAGFGLMGVMMARRRGRE